MVRTRFPIPFAPAAALLLLAGCGQAQPQSPPGGGGGGSDAVQAARALLRATNFDQQLQATVERTADATMTTMLREMRAQRGGGIAPGLEAELRRIVNEENRTLVAEMRRTALDDAARIYARYFTADEIRELQQLQTAPVMVKFQRIAPQFVAELSQIGVAVVARRMPESQRRVREAVLDWHRRNPG